MKAKKWIIILWTVAIGLVLLDIILNVNRHLRGKNGFGIAVEIVIPVGVAMLILIGRPRSKKPDRSLQSHRQPNK